MSSTVSLRSWQREALESFGEQRQSSFLTVACPGAGKTTFALAATRQRLAGERLPVCVVVPTQHLKHQWAEAAVRFGLHLDPDWSANDGRLPSDMHGVIVTYAQAARSSRVLANLTRGGMVVLDEVHHAASEKSWGDGVEEAFYGAECRLLLSGTPFRTDDSPIPFVTYSFGDYGDAVPQYEYGYGEALEDGGVVRPVFFPRFDGHMEWINAEGAHVEGTFADDLDRTEWSGRLRTALSLDGEWLPTVLDKAHAQLINIRKTHPGAGGLVIATDHEHAKGIAEMLERRTGVPARIALSDDPRASHVISRFATGNDPWIVAVRMISEGVDIPRLRVGVFATTTTTAMFFRQAVGRIARWTKGIRSQRAYFYLPDDPRLRRHAADLALQRHHSIEARKTRMAEEGEFDDVDGPERGEEQMSLFAALSSSVLDAPNPVDGLDPEEDSPPGAEADLEGYEIELPPPPPLPGRNGVQRLSDDVGLAALASMQTRKQQKKDLREFNSSRVRELVQMTGLGHAQVNGQLNRESGIERITEATVVQLERRLKVADSWIRRLVG
ncbi:MAG: superfamily II DNA or RNA helicase [Candidatus Poriferisodalaceae bacterium]|jgi:superfamily II DNA or RNA helicase